MGDEGKGKITLPLGQQVDIVAYSSRGLNAHHTITFKDKKIVLHLISSGILRSLPVFNWTWSCP